MNNITISNATRSIELSKKFAAAAAKYGSDEYKMLQEVRRDYPGYEVVEAAKKAKAAKDPYKKLDFDFMEKYILAHEDCEKNMKTYLDLRGKSKEAIENGAASKSLTEIRSWFLSAYPQVAQFHEKREQEMMRLKAEKEKKRAEKKQKPLKTTSNIFFPKLPDNQ